MLCPACRHQNRDLAKFCEECAAPLGSPRPQSPVPVHIAEKIRAAKPALEGERKQVTVLFVDVKGSMALAEELDAEAWGAVMRNFFALIADGVHRFEGTVNQYMGDGVMALFGAPIAHEDHAQRACYAGLHLRDAVRQYAERVRDEYGVSFSVRFGLNSGEVVVASIGDDLRMDYLAQGQVVGLAQRMQSLAEPDQICIAENTARLVDGYVTLRDLGPTRVKGIRQPVRVSVLEGIGSLRTRFDRSRARGLSRFVGREREMARLEAVLEDPSRTTRVVGIAADAGTGKSRLCAELLDVCRARGLTVLEARGLAHGKAVPLLPILELWRSLCSIGADDGPEAIRAKLGARLQRGGDRGRSLSPFVFGLFGVADATEPAPPLDPAEREQQLRDVMQLLLLEPDDAARVILLEDLQWFDPASDALLAATIEAASTGRDLLLVNFRPEYQASWMRSAAYEALALQPLETEATRALLHDRLGGDPLVASLSDLIHARTKGNPFFIEEMTQALLESGSLAGGPGSDRLTAAIDTLTAPPSVQAVLGARIDRLPRREKNVLQTAAVIGQTFDEALLHRILDNLEGLDLAAVRQSLAALTAAQFVYRSKLYPRSEFSFRHPLTCEVAQRSQLRERRIRVHGEAAAQAQARFAYGDARLHLEAGLGLLREQPETVDRQRLEMQLLEDLGTTLFGMWGYGNEDGARAFARMRELAERLDGTRARFQAMEGELTALTMRAEFPAARALGEKLLLLVENLGEPADVALASALLGAALFNMGEVAAAERHAERARALFDPNAPPQPDDVGIPSSIVVASTSGYFGRAGRARELAGEALARAEALGTPFHRALATNLAAQIHMLLEDAGAAAPLAQEAEELAAEYSLAAFRIMATMVRGWCELAGGRVDASRTMLREAFDEYRATGQRYSTTLYSALLARAHVAAGDGAAARELLDTGLRFAAETGERIYEPELYRIKGESLLLGAPSPRQLVAARQFLEHAVELAAERGALLFEIRAARSLAGLDPARERSRLAGLVARFAAEDDCHDLRAAKELLAERAGPRSPAEISRGKGNRA